MLRVGTGNNTNRNARSAGQLAARDAVRALGDRSPQLLLAFATAGHDQQAFLAGISDVTGPVPLAGCSTSGVISRAGSVEGSHAVGVLALASDWLSCSTFSASALSSDALACGRSLGAKVRACPELRGRLLTVFADGLSGNVSEMLAGLRAELPPSIAVAGGTAGDLLKTERTWQYCDGEARSDSVAAVLFGGDVLPEIALSHGCRAIGAEQTVTRAENGWIYEIDGRPAWEVYGEYLDLGESEVPTMSHFCYLCLAVPLPRPDPVYGDYILRCPWRVDTASGAMFFPGNVESGARVRLALRDPKLTLARIRTSTEAMLARHGERLPALVLQFDCCCRGRLLFGAHQAEQCLLPLQALFGPSVPWLGFHTYGEIGPIGGAEAALFHNYALVLCALYPSTRQGVDDVNLAARGA